MSAADLVAVFIGCAVGSFLIQALIERLRRNR